MLTTDCPICDGTAALDAALRTLTCDDCGTGTEISADDPVTFEAAAAA